MPTKGNIATLSAPINMLENMSTFVGRVGRCTAYDLLAAREDNSTVTKSSGGSGYSENDEISVPGGMTLSVTSIGVLGSVISFSIISYGTSTHAGTNIATSSSIGDGFTIDITVDSSIIPETGLVLRGGVGAYFKITSVDSGAVTGVSVAYDDFQASGTYTWNSNIPRDYMIGETPYYRSIGAPSPDDPLKISGMWPKDRDTKTNGTNSFDSGIDAAAEARFGGRVYSVGDMLRLEQIFPDYINDEIGSGCLISIDEVGENGKIISASVINGGSGYYPYSECVGSIDISMDSTLPEWDGDAYVSDYHIGNIGNGDEYLCVFSIAYSYYYHNAKVSNLNPNGSDIYMPSDATFYVASVTPGEGDPDNYGILTTFNIISGGSAKNYSIGDNVFLKVGTAPYISSIVTALADTVVATSATNLANTSFSANWDAFTDALNYELDVATDNSFTSFVTGFQNKSVSALTCQITTLPFPNSTDGVHIYYYRVRAVLADSTTGNSNTITATIPTPTVTATAASGIHTSPTIGFTANWNAVSGANGYKIIVSSGTSFESPVEGYLNKYVETNSCDVVVPSYDIAYQYKVLAVINGWETEYSNVITTTVVSPMLPPGLQLQKTLDPTTNKTSYKVVRNGDGLGARDAYEINSSPDAIINDDPAITFSNLSICDTVARFDVTVPASSTGWYIEICKTQDFIPSVTNGFRSKIYGVGAGNLTAFFDLLTASSHYFVRAYSITVSITDTTAEITKSAWGYYSFETTAAGTVCPTSSGITVPSDNYIEDGSFFIDPSIVNIIFGDTLLHRTRYSVKIRTYSYNTNNSGIISNAQYSPWSEIISFLTPAETPIALQASFKPDIGAYLWIANWCTPSEPTDAILYVMGSDGTSISESPIIVLKESSSFGSQRLYYEGAQVSGLYFISARIYDDVNSEYVYSEYSNQMEYSYTPVALPASERTLDSFIANWTNTYPGITYYLDVARNVGFTSTDLNPYSSADVQHMNEVVSGTSLTIKNLMSDATMYPIGTQYFYRLRAKFGDFYSDYSNVIRTRTACKLYGSGGTMIIYLEWD